MNPPVIERLSTPFFALTFRGLEQTAAAEIAELPGSIVNQIAYRRISGTSSALQELLTLRISDDVFLLAAVWHGIERPRLSLDRIRALSHDLLLEPLVAAIQHLRPIPSTPRFSVSASFVGKRNYTVDEIKQCVAQTIVDQYHWHYLLNDDDADLNVRVFIEHETAWVGLRLRKTPLHDREFGKRSKPGMLKAPIAAALVRLAKVRDGDTVIDPCCGSGTVLLEAKALYPNIRLIGGDIVVEAVELPLVQWDAACLPLADRTINRVISNLPWGAQVGTSLPLEQFYHGLCSEFARVIMPGGRVVLLTTVPDTIALERCQLEQRIEISLFGQTPTILVFTCTGQ